MLKQTDFLSGVELESFSPLMDTEIEFGQGETVLLVESNETLLKLGKSVLEKLNYRVFTALGRDELIKMQYLPQEQIDLFILDTGLPKADGQEIIKKIRQHQPQARIMFAASSDPAICSECCEHIAEELIIHKPYTVHSISRMIYQNLH